MRKRGDLKAGFSVEAAIVMAIIFMCVATLIIFAYHCRDIVYRNYVVSESAERAAYTEEIWKPRDSSLDLVEENADRRLHTIGTFAGYSLSAERDEVSDTAMAMFGDICVKAHFSDAENYMRLSSVIVDFADSYKKDEDNG